MALREKLGGSKMFRNESVSPCLVKIYEVQDELFVIGEKASNQNLVRTTLNMFTK